MQIESAEVAHPPRYMSHKLIAGINSATPTYSTCVEANLISLGGIYSLQTDLLRANSKGVAIHDPWYAVRSAACASEQPRKPANAMKIVFISRLPKKIVNCYRSGLGFHSCASFSASAICAVVMFCLSKSRFFTAS